MKLFDVEGKPVDIPEAQAAEALQSGQYGLPAGSRVPVKLGDGSTGTVAAEDLQTTLASGATLLSPEEHASAVQQAKYGGIGSQAVAGVAGAARGATLGLSDLAARAVGGQGTADYLRNIQEANPITSGVGEVAGTIAPALLTGGASEAAEAPGLLSTAGRLIGAPARLAEAGGDIAERAVSRLLPEEATSLAGRLGSKAAEGAVRGGAEGAAYGAGDQISEQSLSQDPDLDGEKFLSAIGHGALLGAATGGLLSTTGAAGSEVLGSLAPRLRGLAEDQSAKAAGIEGKFARQADDIPGGAKAVGRELLDSGVMKAGETIEDRAPAIAAAKDAAGDAVDALRTKADAAGAQGPEVGTILKSIDDSALPKLELLPSLNKGAIERVNAVQDDIRRIAGLPTRAEAAAQGLGELADSDARLTFQQAAEIRRRIDGEINWASNPLSPQPEMAKAMKAIRGSIEDEIERSMGQVAKDAGGTMLEDYQAAKLRFRRLSIADKAAQSAVMRRGASGIPGATDTLGAVFSLASGHPLVAGAALASGYARRALRERAGGAAAAWLDRIGSLGGVQRATENVDRQISRGVARATGDTSVAAVRAKAAIEGGYEAAARSVIDAVSDSDEHQRTIEAAAAPIAQHSPQVAQAFQRAAIRASIYLANQIPKPPSSPVDSLMPERPQLEPDSGAKAKFLRIYNAVHDPVSVLARVEEGAVTPSEVQAIQATAPATYKQMSDELRARLIDAKSLSYAQRLAISTFLQQPLDESMTLPFVQKMQETGGRGSPPKQAQRAGPRPKHNATTLGRATKLPLAEQTRLAGQPSIT